MSEFDFEELDKAVSGALQPSTTAPASGQADESVKVFGPPAADTPSVAPSPAVAPSSPATERSTDTPASRRAAPSGRFMDMVHPSSDMRTSAPVMPTPSAPVAPTPAPTPEVTPPTTLEPPIETPATPPLESPFLPDAKVEKRPLGGEIPTAPVAPVAAQPAESAPVEQSGLPDPMDFPSNHSEIALEDIAAVEKVEAASVAAEQSAEAAQPVVEMAPPALSTEEPVTVASSITQQYKEQAPAPQQSGAMFDTEAYHQPLPTPTKKRSGVWVVVWIVLLTILGAGVGAAVYFYVLPLL